MDWAKAFAASSTTKLYLDEQSQFWIEVRDQLSQSEERAIGLGAITTYAKGEDLSENMMTVDLGMGADRKLLTYLVDWNLPGPDGKTIDISTPKQKQDAVKNLSPTHYKAIEAVIDDHAAAQKAEKKSPDGNKASTTTS